MRAAWLGMIVAAVCSAGALVAYPAGSVAMQFRVLCADGPLPNDLQYVPSPAATSVPVPFVADRRSTLLTYSGPDRLVFFRESRSRDGRIGRVGVANVIVPAGTRQALLTFLPGGDSARVEEFAIVLVEEPDLRLSRSTIRFFNLSPTGLLVKAADESRELAGWQFEDFRFRVKQRGLVPYGFAIWKADQWEVILDSDLVLAADRRYLMLLLPPVQPESLRFRMKLLEE